MTKSRIQYRDTIRKRSVVFGTVILSISCLSLSVLGQAPSAESALPTAPSATAGPSTSQPSNTTSDGSDQPSSVESGKETLTEQADYFVPMTNRERWVHYAYSLVDPQAIFYSAAQAGINQARNTPHEWGQGAEGYGRRIGSAYAQHVIAATVGNPIAMALHEDNRYFKSQEHGLRRVSYAITSAFLARHDDGSRFISFSVIGGGAAGAFISREWQPTSTSSAAHGAASFGYGMAARVGFNLVREFLPRRLEKFLK